MRRRLLVARAMCAVGLIAGLIAARSVDVGATEGTVVNPGPRLALVNASGEISGGSAVLRFFGSSGGALATVDANGSLSVDPLTLGSTQMSIGFFGGSATLSAVGEWTGTIDPDGGTISLDGAAVANISIGPAQCTLGPFDLALSTATTGGTAYYPFGGTAVLADRAFTVPPVVPDAFCPDTWALLLNAAVPTGPLNTSSFALALRFLAPPVGPGGAPPTTATTAPPPTTTTLDPSTPLLRVADATVTEGDGSSTTIDFVVTRGGGTNGSVWVEYSTYDGTAESPGDYAKKTGTFSFSSGQTTKTISVTVKGDLVGEPSETLRLELLDAAGHAVIVDGTGDGTIVDNDPPGASIDDLVLDEPPGTSTTATFTISLSRPALQFTTISYRTLDATARAPGDYTVKTGTVTIAAGKQSTTLKVSVRNDAIYESDEFFLVELTGIDAGNLADPIGVATIVDAGDDEGEDPPPVPGATIDDVEVDEATGDKTVVTFTVSLPAPALNTVSVQYATRDVTARAPGDYTAKTGSVSIYRGKSEVAVKLTVIGDERVEDVEMFLCEIVSVSNGTIADGVGVASIWDDDF